MLSSSDIKVLRRSSTRKGAIAEWVAVIAPIVLIVMANVNFFGAMDLASLCGASIADIFDSWVHGVHMERSYLGAYILALDMYNTAVMQLFAAGIMAVVAWSYGWTRSFHRRILHAMNECKALEHEINTQKT